MDKYDALMGRLYALAYIANINKDNAKTCVSNKALAAICAETAAAIESLQSRIDCLTMYYPELENSYF